MTRAECSPIRNQCIYLELQECRQKHKKATNKSREHHTQGSLNGVICGARSNSYTSFFEATNVEMKARHTWQYTFMQFIKGHF